MMERRLVLTGKARSGKDWVANRLGYNIVGFADPIYPLCEHLFGTSDKSDYVIRGMMQYIGGVGRGIRDGSRYQLSIDRAMLEEWCRENGSSITGFGTTSTWLRFGRDPEFWLKILLDRLPFVELPVAVTNARFPNELKALVHVGFVHYHAMCSPRTLKHRGGLEGPVARDDTEQMALQFDENPPKNTVWNDEQIPGKPGCVLSLQEMAYRLGVVL